MQQSFVNFLYWFLLKSVEKYYGDSLVESDSTNYSAF